MRRLSVIAAVAAVAEPARVSVWPEGARGALANGERVVSNVHEPSLSLYLPASRPRRARRCAS